MKAAVISRFGGPEVLEVREVPDPVPRARDVVVRIKASALNRADLLQRLGRYAPPNDAPPDVAGMELSGEVEALGSEVTRWRVGDRVFGLVGGGAHAERVAVHEDVLAPVPGELDSLHAGAIPEAFITAHDALVSQAGLKAGETVLVLAVGSGVGLAAVQIARAWGAIPFGTSRTSDKIQRAKQYGLEDGVVLESPEGLADAVARFTAKRGVDVVLDLVGGPYLSECVEALALRGRIMLVGALAGSQATIDVRRIFGKRLTLRGTVLRSRSLREKAEVTSAFSKQVVPRLAAGELRPVIDSVYRLEQIAEAHRRMESNASFGKIVIEM